MAEYGAVSGNDVELIDAVPDGWQSEIRQLTAGPLGFRVEWADLPGVSIQRFRVAAAMRWEEVRIQEGFSFAIMPAAEGYPGVHGGRVTPDDVMLQPFGGAMEYMIPPKMTAFAIQVAPPLADTLRWSVPGKTPIILRTSREAMRAFVGVCSEAVQSAKSWGGIAQSPRSETFLRDRVLARIASLLAPRFGEPERRASTGASREYLLVKRAEAWYASRGLDDRPAITAVANALGVSVRTLHGAFATWTGVSPGRYFTLSRLHEFRKHLAELPPSSGVITRAAMDAGFDHLGRLAGDYRKLFGETPSETLCRWETDPVARRAARFAV